MRTRAPVSNCLLLGDKTVRTALNCGSSLPPCFKAIIGTWHELRDQGIVPHTTIHCAGYLAYGATTNHSISGTFSHYVGTGGFFCKSQLTGGSLPLTCTVAAQMAELVDAQVSGICAARRGGSSPLLGTISLFQDGTYRLMNVEKSMR